MLDRSRAGDPDTASFGLTRSARNDYLDPDCARLAFEVVDVAAASGVETCWYDLVADDEFILAASEGVAS